MPSDRFRLDQIGELGEIERLRIAAVEQTGQCHRHTGDDQLGEVFAHDIRAAGIRFDTAARAGDPPTARCLIFVTPDGQRTMNTFLGACVTFGPDDVDEAEVASAAVTYLEGYLFDPPAAQAAFMLDSSAGRKAGANLKPTRGKSPKTGDAA